MIFHVLLLKQNITQKWQIDQINNLFKLKIGLETRNNKEYKVKSIVNNVVYGKEIDNKLQDL